MPRNTTFYVTKIEIKTFFGQDIARKGIIATMTQRYNTWMVNLHDMFNI